MLDKDLLRSRECKDLGGEASHEVLTQPQTSNVVQMYQPNLFDSWGKYQQCLKHGLITFVTIKKSCPLHIAHEFPEGKRQFTNQVSLEPIHLLAPVFPLVLAHFEEHLILCLVERLVFFVGVEHSAWTLRREMLKAHSKLQWLS